MKLTLLQGAFARQGADYTLAKVSFERLVYEAACRLDVAVELMTFLDGFVEILQQWQVNIRLQMVRASEVDEAPQKGDHVGDHERYKQPPAQRILVSERSRHRRNETADTAHECDRHRKGVRNVVFAAQLEVVPRVQELEIERYSYNGASLSGCPIRGRCRVLGPVATSCESSMRR